MRINLLSFFALCEDLCWNQDKSIPDTDQKSNGSAERAVCRVKAGTSAPSGSVGSLRKVVERSNGVLVLFAKHTRQTGRKKVTVFKKTWKSL